MLSAPDSFHSEDASATRVGLDWLWSKLRTHARRLVGELDDPRPTIHH
ncbi:hypothetical protein ZOD2009_07044 [Haladaptatus paucihalophilus DX253]|uniref:Uncharacterized protein n=1 Tax=Haladaptatus paucihalophilus DX253 TaxID=797209 RepID=E7QRI6_HALPU|nr:hypothetical protein [Haladaptatus sp. T7]EFW92605.1 hypothetical protein ZOD2009_07044 [Haladaptatus paucihalophilus DX253]